MKHRTLAPEIQWFFEFFGADLWGSELEDPEEEIPDRRFCVAIEIASTIAYDPESARKPATLGEAIALVGAWTALLSGHWSKSSRDMVRCTILGDLGRVSGPCGPVTIHCPPIHSFCDIRGYPAVDDDCDNDTPQGEYNAVCQAHERASPRCLTRSAANHAARNSAKWCNRCWFVKAVRTLGPPPNPRDLDPREDVE